jgi:hypothetical protein
MESSSLPVRLPGREYARRELDRSLCRFHAGTCWSRVKSASTVRTRSMHPLCVHAGNLAHRPSRAFPRGIRCGHVASDLDFQDERRRIGVNHHPSIGAHGSTVVRLSHRITPGPAFIIPVLDLGPLQRHTIGLRAGHPFTVFAMRWRSDPCLERSGISVSGRDMKPP